MHYTSDRGLGIPNRSKSMPDRFGRELRKLNTIEKAKTDRSTEKRGFSLEERMKERHRSSTMSWKAECKAKQHAEILQDDSLKHLNESIRIAGSIVEKGTDICQELDRQQYLLRKVHDDISLAEYESDPRPEILKGMSSISRKLTSPIKMEPKLKLQTFSNLDNMLNGEMGLCSLSKLCSTEATAQSWASTKDTKQQWVKSGIDELNTTLDVIMLQQLDAA